MKRPDSKRKSARQGTREFSLAKLQPTFKPFFDEIPPEAAEQIAELRNLRAVVTGPRAGSIRILINTIVRTCGMDRSIPEQLQRLLSDIKKLEPLSQTVVKRMVDVCIAAWQGTSRRRGSLEQPSNWRVMLRNAGIYPARGQTRKPGSHKS